MTFEQALTELKKGKMIYRECEDAYSLFINDGHLEWAGNHNFRIAYPVHLLSEHILATDWIAKETTK